MLLYFYILATNKWKFKGIIYINVKWNMDSHKEEKSLQSSNYVNKYI